MGIEGNMLFEGIYETANRLDAHISDLLDSDKIYLNGKIAETSYHARALLLRLKELAIELGKNESASQLQYRHELLSLVCAKNDLVQCVIVVSSGLNNINKDSIIGNALIKSFEPESEYEEFESYCKNKSTDWTDLFYQKYKVELKSEESRKNAEALGYTFDENLAIDGLGMKDIELFVEIIARQ